MPSSHTFRRRHGTPRLLVTFAASVVAFTAGLVLQPFFPGQSDQTLSGAPQAAVPVSAASTPSGAGPARFSTGVPSGFARTEQGATAAAAYFVLSGSALVQLAPTMAAEAVGSMSADATSAARVAEALADLNDLRDVLADGSGPIRYLQAVLAVRTEAYSVDNARVSVWSVGVLSREGVASPQAGWSTSTVDLEWENGDWKVADEQITPGPTPDLNGSDRPAAATDFATRLEGFRPWPGER